jgi:hypothetical protein
MPDFEDGVKALVVSLVGGFVVSLVASSLLEGTMGESGKATALLFNLLFTFVGLSQIERAKFWGITYTTGYIIGLILFGAYFMESWELLIYFIVIGLFLTQKLLRILGSLF